MATEEGAIAFRITPSRPTAFTDELPARFPPFSYEEIRVTSYKNPDGVIHIALDGLHGRSYALSSKIPPCDTGGLHVGINWTQRQVILYLNGKEAQRINVPTH